MSSSLFVQAFVTLLVIFDPLAAIPVFLTLTRLQSPSAQRRTARVSVLVAAGIVAVFAVAGNHLLDALGISLQALQIAGGALLALIAPDLLKADCARKRADAESGAVAFVPLGTPMLAGPGAIAATMLYVEQADSAPAVAAVVLALAAAIAVQLIAGALQFWMRWGVS